MTALQVSRRRLLSAGVAALSAGFAGCSDASESRNPPGDSSDGPAADAMTEPETVAVRRDRAASFVELDRDDADVGDIFFLIDPGRRRGAPLLGRAHRQRPAPAIRLDDELRVGVSRRGPATPRCLLPPLHGLRGPPGGVLRGGVLSRPPRRRRQLRGGRPRHGRDRDPRPLRRRQAAEPGESWLGFRL